MHDCGYLLGHRPRPLACDRNSRCDTSAGRPDAEPHRPHDQHGNDENTSDQPDSSHGLPWPTMHGNR